MRFGPGAVQYVYVAGSRKSISSFNRRRTFDGRGRAPLIPIPLSSGAGYPGRYQCRRGDRVGGQGKGAGIDDNTICG